MPRTTTPTPAAIRWTDPPSTSRANGGDPDRYKDTVAALRANPGRWAVLDEVQTGSQAYRLGKQVREGKYGCTPPGAFDARSHKNGDVMEVRACYKGEPAETAEPQAE